MPLSAENLKKIQNLIRIAFGNKFIETGLSHDEHDNNQDIFQARLQQERDKALNAAVHLINEFHKDIDENDLHEIRSYYIVQENQSEKIKSDFKVPEQEVVQIATRLDLALLKPIAQPVNKADSKDEKKGIKKLSEVSLTEQQHSLLQQELTKKDPSAEHIKELMNGVTSVTLPSITYSAAAMMALTKAFQENTSVVALSAGSILKNPSVGLGQSVAQILKHNPNLKTLNLSNCLDAEGLMNILNALKENSSLTEVILSQHRADSEEVTDALAQVIRNNKTIRSLEISRTPMSAEGAQKIANSLAENQTLENLNLLGSLNDQAVIYIANALKVNTSLRKLNLKMTGDSQESIQAIAGALIKNTTLSELSLTSEEIRIGRMTKIAHALRLNKNLKKLDLSLETPRDAQIIIRTLAEGLKQNSTLVSLDLRGWQFITDGAAQGLLNGLQTNRTLQHIQCDAFQRPINDTNKQVATLLERNRQKFQTRQQAYLNLLDKSGLHFYIVEGVPGFPGVLTNIITQYLDVNTVGTNVFSSAEVTSLIDKILGPLGSYCQPPKPASRLTMFNPWAKSIDKRAKPMHKWLTAEFTILFQEEIVDQTKVAKILQHIAQELNGVRKDNPYHQVLTTLTNDIQNICTVRLLAEEDAFWEPYVTIVC